MTQPAQKGWRGDGVGVDPVRGKPELQAQPSHDLGVEEIGASGKNRTSDQGLMSPLLYR